ncbi:DNA methylase [Clostridiales bacterium PH28_bin88]|nr:DNA methylase [Clostridiales bacterium PH28_bin88]
MSDHKVQLQFKEMIPEKNTGPVECLGLTFESDQARRAFFTEKLRQKLRQPGFRAIEGFPHGSDEDILALSDPPYYTACPNPFIEDFVKHYGQPYDPDVSYSKEPFAADVSEGKNDPIYNAHSYHTKVPHKAIMRYILHYTEPGDLVFDGFCGTGMTGVAAQMCGDRQAVEALGYRVEDDGTIRCPEEGESDEPVWVPFSRLGARRAILNDLSPAATFIAYNYNTPVDVEAFEGEAQRILAEVERECGWMYLTLHQPSGSQVQAAIAGLASPAPTPGLTFGRINYTVWSDVFTCPECAGEVVFWEAAVDREAGEVKERFSCPHCSASLTKRHMQRAWNTRFDKAIGQTVRQAKQVPVLINYSVGNKRYEKTPDAYDLALIEKIEKSEIPYWFPKDPLPDGYNTRQPMESHGVTYLHHFYTKRNLWVLANVGELSTETSTIHQFVFTSMINRATRMNSLHIQNYFFGGGGCNAGYLKGTLYIPSISIETSVIEQLGDRAKAVTRGLKVKKTDYKVFCISTVSSQELRMESSSIDYIFLDPPFGSNLMYSELNFLWEAWLKVFTNNQPEAIENKVQGKTLDDYRHLMTDCFQEAFRVLKPGRWMTVEFSNTQASVWNTIQTALQEAGFVVANVAALDKKQGSFKAVTTTKAVKQDLVISAYKPNGGLEERFARAGGSEEGVWEFVRSHLKYLPVFKASGGTAEFIDERDPRILYDRMVAYFVTHGYLVPLDTHEFQAGLRERFDERDGMYFLPDQAAEYDRKRMRVAGVGQLSIFVCDERSAIDWLRDSLKRKPQTYQEIHPGFMKQIAAGWQKHEVKPELAALLEQNFLQYEGQGPIPTQVVSWLKTSSNYREKIRQIEEDHTSPLGLLTRDPELLHAARERWYVPDPNQARDLEKLRERALLKEFEEYRQSTQRKIKLFRLEAVRAGFKKAWSDKDYATIIAVAKKIPDTVLQEDPKLLMWYDQAVTRTEGTHERSNYD